MAQLIITDNATVRDNRIYKGLKILTSSENSNYSFRANIRDNSSDENCDLFVDISLAENLENLFAEEKTFNELNLEFTEFSDEDLNLFNEIYELIRETSNEQRTFFTVQFV